MNPVGQAPVFGVDQAPGTGHITQQTVAMTFEDAVATYRLLSQPTRQQRVDLRVCEMFLQMTQTTAVDPVIVPHWQAVALNYLAQATQAWAADAHTQPGTPDAHGLSRIRRACPTSLPWARACPE